MIFEQYPYDLMVQSSSGGGYDENGSPVPETTSWVYHSKCRDTPAGTNNTIGVDGGDVVNYHTKVVMPVGTPEIKANIDVRIYEGDTLRTSGSVLRFSTKQLHARLWL